MLGSVSTPRIARGTPRGIDRRSLAFLAAVLIATAVLAAIAFAPARLLSDRMPGHAGLPASGTVWSGATVLQTGERMTWKLRPLDSLLNSAAVAAVRVQAEDVDLSGEARVSRQMQAVHDLNGWMGWSAVRRAAPALALTCDARLRVTDASFQRGPALTLSGSATSDASACSLATRSFRAPATQLTAQTRNGENSLTVVSQETNDLLAALAIEPNGMARISITPAAQALAGGAPAAGDIVVELGAP